MTMMIYGIQSEAAQLCDEAKEMLADPTALSRCEAVGALALARIISLTACLKACADPVFRFWRHVVKIIIIPILERLSFDSVVRVAIASVLSVTVMGLRVLSCLGGVVSPELMFGVLKLHRFLLRLGLINRSQFSYMGTLPPPLELVHIHDQRWRWGIVSHALQQIEEFEERHHGRGHIVGFGEDIWRIAERQALEDEIRGIEEQFRRPVHVPHPILEIFQGKFAAALHSEASALYQQNLYTREEIEDMVTAFPAVMHRATYKAIVESFRLCGAAYDEKAHLGEVLLADGTELAGADAGGLEEWNAKLKEILLLINEMPDAACENLLYYLCADEEAIHRVRPDLPPRASNPTLDRCFRLIIEFYTTFIAHHMPADSSALQQAFSLDEIS